MQHPNIDVVQRLIDSLLGEHRLTECRLEGLRFDLYSSSYNLVISKEEHMVKVKIPSELIDRVMEGSDSFGRRKIKDILKDALIKEGV